MVKGKSKLVPQHQHWYEDLPDRGVPTDRAPKMVHDDVNAMDEVCLEISRASSLMRGVCVVFGIIGAVFFTWIFSFLIMVLFPIEQDFLPFIFMLPFMFVLAAGLVILVFRLDLTVPRDRPVRFNRVARKVYVNEHSFTMNPFSSWPVAIKEFEWDTLHAELHRQAGFSGKAYIQRFSLWLVSCKPGTHEVVDRFELKGNHPVTAELYNAWAYCRHYMEQGPEGLPVYPPRRQEVSFRRSLFEYIRFLDPTEEGREVRARMTTGDWLFNLPLTLLMFWMFIPWGIGHYIAMRFAPEAKWPPEIDAESRGV